MFQGKTEVLHCWFVKNQYCEQMDIVKQLSNILLETRQPILEKYSGVGHNCVATFTIKSPLNQYIKELYNCCSA